MNISQQDQTFWIKNSEKEVKLNLNEFNESQKKVIVQCSSILNSNEPKLCFIQGPPGTGKSHTIVGTINALFTVKIVLFFIFKLKFLFRDYFI